MADKVVSFFFLGTACHRSSYEDALTNFYNATSKHTVSRLFDGVGSHPERLADTHPTPGRYIYDPEEDKKIPANEKITRGIRDLMQRLQGCLGGDGMDELLFESILYLENLIRKNDGVMPETINLHGYSRGADACMRLANLLDSMYPNVKVNMFLVDHVPGPGRADDPSSYTVPRNVRKFESVIMLHEYKPGFNPQDRNRYVISNPEKTKVAIKVYPGWHGKAMYLTPDEKTNHVPRLLHDDFFRFTKETGSLPEDAEIPNYKIMHTWTHYEEKKAQVLNSEQRFKEYEGMLAHWGNYAVGGWSLINTRAILTDHRHYTQSKELFVNQEHGELFMSRYPALYDWFLDENLKQLTTLEVKEQLEKLSKEFPFFYSRLCKVCGIEGDKLPPPGKAAPYFHPPLDNPLVNDDYSFLQHSILSIINYTFHHSKEDSLEIRAARRVLNDTLEKAKTCNSPELAMEMMQRAVRAAAAYLDESKPTSYMAKQLKKLAIGPNEYIEQVGELIELHCRNNRNRELHYSQKNYLQDIRQQLESIKMDSQLGYLQKLREAKAIVKKIPKTLQQMQEKDTTIFIHNHMAPRLYFYSDKILTIKQLTSAINQLNAPGFGEISIAQKMARRFAGYTERNRFWEGVKKVLSAVIPIHIPPFFTPFKNDLAIELGYKLHKLDEKGKGNDITKIAKIIASGERQIHKYYSDTRRLVKGEFDRILEKCRGDIWPEIEIAPAVNTYR